jgi:hypothetical protein
MAGNKRRADLDQPTRDHLKGIEAALEAMIQKPKQEDEFTAMELYQKLKASGAKNTIESVRFRLDRMVLNGEYQKRKIISNGSITNLYRII